MCADTKKNEYNQETALSGLYLTILEILEDYQKAHPLFFCPCRVIRSTLNTPIDVLRPYAENLELNGYVIKRECFGKTYMLKITKKGSLAVKNGSVTLDKKCRFYNKHKLRVLEYLKKERDAGNDAFYIADNSIRRALGYGEKEITTIIDELQYCGLVRTISIVSPRCTVQITQKGLIYLEENSKAKGQGAQ